MHGISRAQARNAYSAMLLLPGYSQLRFLPILAPFKREWNLNVEKYATFWNPETIVRSMAASTLDWHNVVELRNRLIFVCKLLCLHRSIDLSRLLRTVSVVNGTPFMLIQRKGWKTHKWEEIISISSAPSISPWHLIKKYVELTSNLVPPGSPLLITLRKTFKPLSSNAIGSLTKRLMTQYGIPPGVWGAHSTRGLGFSSTRNWV